MNDEEKYPPACPECNSEKIEIHRESEYTGGGYADYWEEYECTVCGYVWRSDKDSDYF